MNRAQRRQAERNMKVITGSKGQDPAYAQKVGGMHHHNKTWRAGLKWLEENEEEITEETKTVKMLASLTDNRTDTVIAALEQLNNEDPEEKEPPALFLSDNPLKES